MNKDAIENTQQAESLSNSGPLDLDQAADLDNQTGDEPNLLSESGIISSIDGEFAYVDAQRQSGCSGCAS